MDEQQRIISSLSALWESPKEMKWTRLNHGDNVTQKIASMFLSQHLSDVTLLADGSNSGFPCHRMVLTIGSRYFQRMFESEFKEASSTHIVIKEIQHHVLKSVLKYLYLGEVEINVDNIQGLLHASDMMLLDSLKQGCIEFYQQFISAENCLGIWQVSDQCNATVLRDQSLNFALEDFSSVYKATEFLELSPKCLGFYLEHKDLHIQRDEEVCLAFMKWLHYAPQSRNSHLMYLLPKLRLLYQTPLLIKDLLLSDPVISKNREAASFLEATVNHLTYKSMLPSNFQLQPIRSHSENPPTCVVIGGFVDNRRSKVCQAVRYEENAPKTTTGTAVITELPSVYNIEMACCVWKNLIYISGAGCNADEIWSLDVSRTYWIKCSEMNQGRICHAMIAHNSDKIYIIGGYNQTTDTVFSDIEQYDIQKNSTTSIGQLKNAIACCTAQLISSTIYTFGGASDDERPSSCIQMFNTITREATLLPLKLPTGALRLKSQVCVNKIIAIGMKESFVIDMMQLHEIGCHFSESGEKEDISYQEKYPTIIKQVGGIGKDLFGLELLGDKLLILGGRYHENDNELAQSIEVISVSEFLKNHTTKWTTTGTLIYPTAVYMTGLVSMKNSIAMDNQVTAL